MTYDQHGAPIGVETVEGRDPVRGPAMPIIIEGEACPSGAHWHWNGSQWEMPADSTRLVCPVRLAYHDAAAGVLETITVAVYEPLRASG